MNEPAFLEQPRPILYTRSLFAGYKIEKPKPIRQQLIDEAFIEINKSRQGTKYKPVTKKTIALRVNMSCKSNMDCHYLLTACRKGNFSRVFWGATKVK